MKRLSEQSIIDKLSGLNNWQLDNNCIKREWIFKDFVEAIQFLNLVADLAEQHNHHPEIFNVYNKVTIKYSTHDAGGVTDKDFALAAEIDKLSL